MEKIAFEDAEKAYYEAVRVWWNLPQKAEVDRLEKVRTLAWRRMHGLIE